MGQSAAVIARGRIHPAGEPSADVRVVLQIDERSASLSTQTQNLGSWSLADVRIAPAPDGTFRFAAEGDEMVFIADRPSIAARLSAYIGAPPDEAPTRRRRRRRSRRRTRETATFNDGHLAVARVAEDGRVETRTERAFEPPVAEPPATSEVRHARHRTRAVPEPPTAPPAELAPAPPAELPAVAPAAERRLERAAQPEPSDESTSAKAPGAMRTTASRAAGWMARRAKLSGLWMLEHLRQTDIYGLDRIPVVTDDMRLEGDHEHAFERRPGFPGTVREVCTECGKVRLTQVRVETSTALSDVDASDTTNPTGSFTSREPVAERRPELDFSRRTIDTAD